MTARVEALVQSICVSVCARTKGKNLLYKQSLRSADANFCFHPGVSWPILTKNMYLLVQHMGSTKQ